MDELILAVGQAKAFVDNGLCRIGKDLRPDSAAGQLLSGGASRSVVLGDSIAQLCRQDHASEALPLLRELAEVAVTMRWAAGAADPDSAAAEVLKDIETAGWDGRWDAARFRERAEAAGAAGDEAELVLGSCPVFVLAGRSVTPWSHVYEGNRRPGMEAERVMRSAVHWMGHVLKAMETRWPGSFPGAQSMWEKSA